MPYIATDCWHSFDMNESSIEMQCTWLHHYIDGNHYIALITLNTTVILKMDCPSQKGQVVSLQPI